VVAGVFLATNPSVSLTALFLRQCAMPDSRTNADDLAPGVESSGEFNCGGTRAESHLHDHRRALEHRELGMDLVLLIEGKSTSADGKGLLPRYVRESSQKPRS
jgi:hypothetical protein